MINDNQENESIIFSVHTRDRITNVYTDESRKRTLSSRRFQKKREGTGLECKFTAGNQRVGSPRRDKFIVRSSHLNKNGGSF